MKEPGTNYWLYRSNFRVQEAGFSRSFRISSQGSSVHVSSATRVQTASLARDTYPTPVPQRLHLVLSLSNFGPQA